MREQWRQPYTPFPRHIVRQFQSPYTPLPRGHVATPYSTSVSVPLYAITARGQLPRNSATPYSTSVSVSLYAITARSITNQRTSSGVGIGFTFLPHVIIPDKRNGVHWTEYNSCHRDARAI